MDDTTATGHRRGIRRPRIAALTAAASILGLGLAVPVTLGNVASPASAQVVAPPEVWEAYDNDRPLTGQNHAVFSFTVPAGSYAITAKANVLNNNDHVTTVHCQLRATDSGNSNWDYGSTTVRTAQEYQSMAMSVVHRFTVSAPIVLDCYHNTTSTQNNSTLRYVKITATRVNALHHVAL